MHRKRRGRGKRSLIKVREEETGTVYLLYEFPSLLMKFWKQSELGETHHCYLIHFRNWEGSLTVIYTFLALFQNNNQKCPLFIILSESLICKYQGRRRRVRWFWNSVFLRYIPPNTCYVTLSVAGAHLLISLESHWVPSQPWGVWWTLLCFYSTTSH